MHFKIWKNPCPSILLPSNIFVCLAPGFDLKPSIGQHYFCRQQGHKDGGTPFVLRCLPLKILQLTYFKIWSFALSCFEAGIITSLIFLLLRSSICGLKIYQLTLSCFQQDFLSTYKKKFFLLLIAMKCPNHISICWLLLWKRNRGIFLSKDVQIQIKSNIVILKPDINCRGKGLNQWSPTDFGQFSLNLSARIVF